MVGDDMHGDVEGALNAGLRAMLMQTGKYRPDSGSVRRPVVDMDVVDAVLQPQD